MKLILSNLNIRTGKRKDSLKVNYSILIENDKIIDIFPSQDDKYYDIKHINCMGLYATPGLINMHVHLFGSGKPSKTLGKGKSQENLIRFIRTKIGNIVLDLLVRSNAKKELLGGVTTCRTVGDFCYSDVKLRDLINEGKVFGPKLIVSGPAITSSNGHGAGTFAYGTDDIDELKSLVRLNASKGVDFIKICTTGGVMDSTKVGEPGIVRMSEEQVKAVVEEAHKLGLKVASHTESPKGVIINANTGVDFIEHGSTFDDQTEELLKKNNTVITLTLSPALPLATLDPIDTKLTDLAKINSKVVTDNMISGVAHAIRKDIPVAVGTDASCPFAFQHLAYKELVYISKYLNLEPELILEMMTYGNAKALGLDKEIGSLEKNKIADILLTKEDPIESFEAYGNLEMVIHNGRIIKKPRVNKFKHYKKLLDTI